MNNLNILKYDPEEKIAMLEKKLHNVEIGRIKDSEFADAEYAKLCRFALSWCDGFCKGDSSVGIDQCPYWNEPDYCDGFCALKKFIGED